MKRIMLFAAALTILVCMFTISAFADETTPESYETSDTAYTVYTDAQYTEVITGIYNGTLENKRIVFGCDIETTTDFVMSEPCDITIDLNGFTYTNNRIYNKSGDFDFQNKDAILRISNGYINSSFCVFIFRITGQLYAENIEVSSSDECVYQYGGHSAVVSLKNCKMDARKNFASVSLNGNCGGNGGSLYEIEGGEYAGLNIYCARPGSYVKDCRVYEQKLIIDSWHQHDVDENGRAKDVTLEIRNVNVESGEIYLNDQAIDPVLYDCTFTTVNLSNKTNAVIVSYTSPTCTKAGTKTTYHNLTSITVDEQYPIDNPATGHTVDMENLSDIVYTSYTLNGKYISACVSCGEESAELATAPALFECYGYSSANYVDSILIGFSANADAIKKYEDVTGKSVKYGVFATSENVLGDGDIIGEDGSYNENAVIAEITGSEHSAFELKIKGFSESTISVYLALGAFVIATDTDGETDVAYIQSTEYSELRDKYYFTTFGLITNNQVVSE